MKSLPSIRSKYTILLAALAGSLSIAIGSGGAVASASQGGVVSSTPLGVPAPSTGWTPVFADGFNAPLGTAPGNDNLWFPNEPGIGAYPTTPSYADNGFDTNAYASSQVTESNNQLLETATYSPDILNAVGNHVQANYLSGMVATTTTNWESCSKTRKVNCYQGWDWIPAPGATWAFQIQAQFPVNSGEMFNAFWSTNDSTTSWSNERDFFEGRTSTSVMRASSPSDVIIDSDWIYQTSQILQDIFFQDFETQLGFNPSTAMHTYTYVVYPNQSWSFYIDGAEQMWIGGGTGVAPPRTSSVVPLELRINYALNANTFTSGSRTFAVNSVAVYEDSLTAGLPGHPYSSGTLIAPGTQIASG